MKRAILDCNNLTIQSDAQEQIEGMNLVLQERETYLLWGKDSTPRFLANMFRGNCRIRGGNLRLNGVLQTECRKENFEENGIYYVDGQVELIESLTLAENLFLLKDNSLRKLRLNKKALLIRTKEIFEKYGLDLDANQKVRDCSAIDKILFQLVRLADRNIKMLVLSNPTIVCGPNDSIRLVKLIRKLQEEGLSFLIYDTHVEYFLDLADDYYVLYGGKLIKKFWMQSRFEDYLDRMVDTPDTENRDTKGNVLTFTKTRKFILDRGNRQEQVLQLYPGETVFIQTSGWEEQQELCNELMGKTSTRMIYESGDSRLSYDDPGALAKQRVIFWGQESLDAEYFPKLSVRDNIILPSVRRISRLGFHIPAENFVFQNAEFFPDLKDLENRELTDESILKILCYRWKFLHPAVLILHNILSRADLETRRWLEKELMEMAKRGTSLILLETYMEDALPVADRSVVWTPKRGFKG